MPALRVRVRHQPSEKGELAAALGKLQGEAQTEEALAWLRHGVRRRRLATS